MDSRQTAKRGPPSPSEMNSKKPKLDARDLSIPTPTQFCKSATPQEFSLPMPIMKYVWENPSAPEVYEKLIQCCKLFFIKNQIFVLDNLEFDASNGWKKCVAKDCRGKLLCTHKHENIDMHKFPDKKLWISKTFSVYSYSPVRKRSRIISNFISKMHRINVKVLELSNEDLTYDELKFLATSVKECWLFWNTVKDNNGEMVPLEDIMKAFSGADKVFINFSHYSDNSACKSYDAFIEACSAIKKVGFHLIPDNFNVCEFYRHLKLSKSRTLFEIFSWSDEDRLQEVINEILKTPSFEFVSPIVNYFERDEAKLKKMREIQEREAAKFS